MDYGEIMAKHDISETVSLKHSQKSDSEITNMCIEQINVTKQALLAEHPDLKVIFCPLIGIDVCKYNVKRGLDDPNDSIT